MAGGPGMASTSDLSGFDNFFEKSQNTAAASRDNSVNVVIDANMFPAENRRFENLVRDCLNCTIHLCLCCIVQHSVQHITTCHANSESANTTRFFDIPQSQGSRPEIDSIQTSLLSIHLC